MPLEDESKHSSDQDVRAVRIRDLFVEKTEIPTRCDDGDVSPALHACPENGLVSTALSVELAIEVDHVAEQQLVPWIVRIDPQRNHLTRELPAGHDAFAQLRQGLTPDRRGE